MTVTGLLLAAGRGKRMGVPKALVRGADGVPWLVRSRQVLLDGGCDDVLVVLGAEADEAAGLVPDADVVVAAEWSDGMGESLRVGLEVLDRRPDVEAVVIHLVDLPDVGSDVVRRVLALASPTVVARATYANEPGHPVLIGREHWADLAAGLQGDTGARNWLRGRDVTPVDCSDLASGEDVDTPDGI